MSGEDSIQTAADELRKAASHLTRSAHHLYLAASDARMDINHSQMSPCPAIAFAEDAKKTIETRRTLLEAAHFIEQRTLEGGER